MTDSEATLREEILNHFETNDMRKHVPTSPQEFSFQRHMLVVLNNNLSTNERHTCGISPGGVSQEKCDKIVQN